MTGAQHLTEKRAPYASVSTEASESLVAFPSRLLLREADLDFVLAVCFFLRRRFLPPSFGRGLTS